MRNLDPTKLKYYKLLIARCHDQLDILEEWLVDGGNFKYFFNETKLEELLEKAEDTLKDAKAMVP